MLDELMGLKSGRVMWPHFTPNQYVRSTSPLRDTQRLAHRSARILSDPIGGVMDDGGEPW